jgi:hypothetical protein
MSTNTAQTLLAEIEPLKHNDRVARVVDAGRRAASGDAGAAQAIRELRASPDAYPRLLALLSAYGSRDGAIILESLSDVSRSVRRCASRMVARFCDDAQAAAALESIVERRTLARTIAALARRRRAEPVDKFLAARMKKGREPVIVDLLSMGSEGLIQGFMKEIEEGGGHLAWGRLAARHPAFTAAWFLADLKRGAAIDVRQRYRMVPVLMDLARRAPDATLKLIQALFDMGEDPYTYAASIGLLARRRPRETFDLLKARHESARPTRPPGAFGVARFDKVAHKLGAERLDYLVRNAYSTLSDGKRGVRWFLRLVEDDQRAVLRAFLLGGRGGWGAFLFRYIKADSAEEQGLRERAFERWSRAAQGTDGTISPNVLDWLPRDLREREARRHLSECPALQSKPELRLPYARLLPFNEAKEILKSFLGHPEGEERAKAQRILIASVFHDRAAMSDAIANVKARKFEQDPVRLAMFEALVGLPIARFSPDQLPAVGAVVQDALDAADLSRATAAAVERLVIRLFRLDGAWGAGWVAKLFAVRGSVSTYGLGDGLTKTEAERLSPALADLARIWATQERAGAVITLSQSLGVRLKVVEPLLAALERLARELPFVGVAAMALALLNEHDRARFIRLVPELLRDDESFVLLPVVARFISLRRQDLLTSLLEHKPMKGRFATGRTHWVIDFGVGYARWTAKQQRAYAEGLIGLLSDTERDVPTLRFAISTLVRLPFADATPILPFASDPRQPVREMAIRGLPWLDARQGVPVLIEALGDDRARWAIYALRKVFSELRREQVLAELRSVPTNKVTVAKEVVRLLGEMGGNDAYEDLLKLDKPGTHRDVRVALLRALWDHLERPETWQVFERAVSDPDWIVASKLADIPVGRLSAEAEERVVTLIASILGRAEPEARLDLLKRAAYVPLRDLKRSLFQRLLAHMGTRAPEEAAEALAAVLHRMQSSEADTVSKRFIELLPERRHLVAFLPVLTARLGPYAQGSHVKIGEALLKALRADPLTTPHYLSLGSRLWDWKKLGEVLIELSKKDLLHHDAFVAALSAIGACVHPGSLEEVLRTPSDWRLRRLGLAALVEAASPKNGWTKERRARLAEYQKDSAPGVAGPASFVFPP